VFILIAYAAWSNDDGLSSEFVFFGTLFNLIPLRQEQFDEAYVIFILR
jgi:hypothetical protein